MQAVFLLITDSPTVRRKQTKLTEKVKHLGPEQTFGGCGHFVPQCSPLPGFLFGWSKGSAPHCLRLCASLRLPSSMFTLQPWGNVCAHVPRQGLGCVSRACHQLLPVYNLTWAICAAFIVAVSGESPEGKRVETSVFTMLDFDSRISKLTDWHSCT